MWVKNSAIMKSSFKSGFLSLRLVYSGKGSADEPDKIYELIDLSGNFEVKYIRGRYLGKGGYAKCYEVTQARSKRNLACKIVRKNSRLRGFHSLDQNLTEMMIHQTLKHPHIVEFYSYFEDRDSTYIILELCEEGSLLQLSNKRGAITEPEARYFLRQICEGVMYLHEKENIIHRDLKPANIFITSGMNLKIGDFGLATELAKMKCRQVGTPNYMAPEIAHRTAHGFEADIWSIGCILYALLIGFPPFETKSITETLKKVKAVDYEIPEGHNLPPAAVKLIQRCLQLDPSSRPTAREILMDNFLMGGFIPDSLPLSSMTEVPSFRPAVQQARLVLARNFTMTLSQLPKLYETWYKTSKSAVLAFPNGTFQALNFFTRRKISLFPGAVIFGDPGKRKRKFWLRPVGNEDMMKAAVKKYLEKFGEEPVKSTAKLMTRLLFTKVEVYNVDKVVYTYLMTLAALC